MRMRKALLIAGIALLCSAAAPLRAQAPSAPAPSSQSAAAPPPSSVKVQTRLITVDVVATDSHGDLIRDLTAADFQVFDEHSGQQKIARLEFIATPAALTGHGPGA